MRKQKNLGIIGNGFVGNAIASVFKKYFNVLIFDVDSNKRNISSINELVKKTYNIFVCVPTPMFIDTGECDTSILENVLRSLDKICEKHNVIVKSTTPPDKIELFEKKFKHLNLIANPEFLTEKNAEEDFVNQDRIILGGRMLGTISKIYKEVFPDVPIYKTNVKTAMMMKYMTNCFLATKVSFANEMYQICEKLGIKYDEVKELFLLDKRIGKSHLSVPNGDPPKLGWSKSCFPKDLNGLKYLGNKLDVDTKILKSVWEKNLEVRPERDWEKLTGQAISKNEKN